MRSDVISVEYYMRSRFLTLSFVVILLGSSAQAQQRVFTNKEGVKISAEIVSVNPDWKKMTIRKDGNSFAIEPKVLVLDDQQYVKNWLRERGITAPIDPASAPVENTVMPPDAPSVMTVDPSQTRFEVVVKRKLLESDRKKYSTYVRLETKKYAYDITVTSQGRETVPPVKIGYALVWKEGVSFDEGMTTYSLFSGSKNQFAMKGEKEFPQLSYNRAETFTTDAVEMNTVVYEGGENYGEDEFLGVLVKIELADGTSLYEFANTEAGSNKLTWEAAKALSSTSGRSIVSAPLVTDDRYNLQLKKGQSHPGPINFANKRITISAKVDPDVQSPDGVIVAIGGSEKGMSLYVKDRQVYGCIRSDADVKWVAKPTPLGAFEAVASLNASGLSLSINAGSAAQRSDVELFDRSSNDGVDIGRDTGELAGDYAADFDFDGGIEDVRILIRE